MRQPRSSTSARSASNAGTTCSAGSAYSISRKRTERWCREDVRGQVRELPVPPQLRRRPVDEGDRRRRQLSDLARDLMQPGSDDHVVEPLPDARERLPWRAHRQACVHLRHGEIGVREPVELEVVVRARHARRAHRAPGRESSGRSSACRTNAGTHCRVTSTRIPSAPRPSAHRGEEFGVLGLAHRQQVAGCRHQRRTRRPASRFLRTARRCHACRSRSRRRSTGGRCHRGSPSRGRGEPAASAPDAGGSRRGA